jgi:hypothetical protein
MKIFVAIMTVIGLIVFIGGFMAANGSPQEAAAAGAGIACGVLPYILYKLGYCSEVLKNQKKIIRLLEKENKE